MTSVMMAVMNSFGALKAGLSCDLFTDVMGVDSESVITDATTTETPLS